MSDHLPAYIRRPAESVHLQPYACRNTQMYGFYLKADAAIMQARLVDPILNAPTGGALDYRVLSDMVLLSFAYAAQGTSTLPPDNAIGWVPENSWTLWIPLVEVKHELGFTVGQRLVMYPAYICVDNSWSLAAGREVYGFPKGYGPLVIPKQGEAATSFSAATLVMKKFGPQNEGVIAPLIEVQQTAAQTRAETIWTDAGEAIGAIAHMVVGGGQWIVPGLSLIEDIVSLATRKEVPGVFLRQFRDAGDGTRASYQAVIEAGSFVTAFHSGGLLHGSYSATIAEYDSHPLASDLGIAPGTVPLELGFWVNFDFTIGAGREVWKAATND